MIKNYLKIAFRNLRKRKTQTFINILGLSTGMAVCLLIVLFIKDELGYDSFHTKKDRIYRVVLERMYPGRSTSYAIIPLSIGEAIKKEFPEVEESMRLFSNRGFGNFFVKINDKIFEEKNVVNADSNFFRVFTAKMLGGDPNTALEKPNSVVLNETTAKKYYGSASAAMGKTMEIDGGASLLVTGVCEDWPEHTHFLFDLLISNATFLNGAPQNFINFSANTYLLLKENASAASLESKLPQIVEKYVSGQIEQQFGQSFQQFKSAGNGYHYYLQPLTKIHLHSDLEAELRPNGSQRAVTIFAIIAVFILFIACINFINLSTARSVERAKEVGVRKTFGSERASLVKQFLMESVLICLLSVVLAGVMILLILPLFNQVSGKHLSYNYFLHPAQLFTLLAFSVGVGVIAGIYPAFVLSSFRPIAVLRGKLTTSRYGKSLRNGLVGFQFFISVILIICTLVVNMQMGYVLGDKLGFRKDHVITVERTDLLDRNTIPFKNEVMKIPGVQNISGTTAVPGTENYFGVSFALLGSKDAHTGRGLMVDDQYLTALDLKLASGRFFSKEFALDTLGILLNEKAVTELGIRGDPIGVRLTSPDPQLNAPDGMPYTYTVVGVLKDFHFQTLHQQIAPLFILNVRKFGPIDPLMTIRISADNFSATVKALESKWKLFVKERPFNYTFLDQSLAELYHAEETTKKIFSVFSILAIFIACIGLLGLIAYTTQQRIREIGIRKVLGASIPNILVLLGKNFFSLILIASLIAFPVGWWAMHKWLQDFAYRVSIPWWIFILAMVLAALVALITISFQAIKAALANPVKSLRTE